MASRSINAKNIAKKADSNILPRLKFSPPRISKYWREIQIPIFFSLRCSHLNKTTTYEDPRKWGTVEQEEVPEPRSVALDRDADMGFGFVAGSEKPVIVRWGKKWRQIQTYHRVFA